MATAPLLSAPLGQDPQLQVLDCKDWMEMGVGGSQTFVPAPTRRSSEVLGS